MPRRAASQPTSEPDDLGILLGLAYQAFVDRLNAQLAHRGFADIRPAFGYVFRALANDSLTSGQLALRLGITAQGAGKLVDQMVDAGYLERRPDTDDRRTKWLELTARGRAALDAAHDIHRTIERDLSADVGPARVRTLREVLERLLQAEHATDPSLMRGLRLP